MEEISTKDFERVYEALRKALEQVWDEVWDREDETEA